MQSPYLKPRRTLRECCISLINKLTAIASVLYFGFILFCVGAAKNHEYMVSLDLYSIVTAMLIAVFFINIIINESI